MKRKNLHIILATTLSAMVLWVSVQLGNQYQASITAPFVLKNLPTGYAMKAAVPRRVVMRLRGEGWQLAPLLLRADLRCVVDVATLPPNQGAITLNDIAERMNIPPGVQILDMKPDSIVVSFDTLGFRKVPVLLDYSATFRERYGRVGPVVVSPESVIIEGAASVLSTIDSWKTTRVVLENLKASVDMTVPLLYSDRYLIAVSPSEVHVKMDVQWFAEKTLSGLSVEILTVPLHREVILIPPRIDFVVRGGVEQLAQLTAADFRATVDYTTLLSDTTGNIEPDVLVPPGVHLVSKRPERFQYVIRKRL